MEITHSLLSVAFLIFHFPAHVTSATCSPDDLKALKALQDGLMTHTPLGTPKPGIESWNISESDCCSWHGVMCEAFPSNLVSGTRVVGLDLVNRNLKGRMSVSQVGLEQLRSLNVSHNLITGALPARLFKLQNLQVVDLSNEISGLFPGKINLPSLLFLDLSENFLSGNINPSMCNNSTRIQVLHLSANIFSGNIPASFGNCTSLERLMLNSNKLFGSLPEDLFKLQKLSYLHLQENGLSGALSEAAANLSKLIQLDISLNEFSGDFPDAFLSLTELQSFTADSNRFSGRLPYSLSNSPTLQLLNIRNNSLHGPININCTTMIQLSSLTLSSNQFHGPLPDRLSLCQKLKTLNLAQNPLGGQVPKNFKNLQFLSALSLTKTSLQNISVALDVLQNCKNLRMVVLTSNFDGEEMPAHLNLGFKSLEALVLPNCNLTDMISKWLRSCSKLQLLDLSANNLSGMIPEWFGLLEYLFYIDLSENLFSGRIPKSLTEMRSLINPPENLIPLEPESLGIPLFKKKYQASPMKYNQIWSFPPTLNLRINLLTGPIWPEFGNLNLQFLDLKRNNLSGPIPAELGSMVSLEILDFSYNNLSGTIPLSLSKLSFLSQFNISYNHMYGVIHLGGQFSTLVQALWGMTA